MKQDGIVIMLHQINPQSLRLMNMYACMGLLNPITIKAVLLLAINYQVSQIRDLWVYLLQHDYDAILFHKFFQQSLIVNSTF